MVSSANIKLKQRSAKSERLAGAHYDEFLRICIECVSDIRILKNGERHITVSYEIVTLYFAGEEIHTAIP